jgi:hypothetical protein
MNAVKMSFNWADPEGRFHGLKKLVFHSMNKDPSMLRERTTVRSTSTASRSTSTGARSRLKRTATYARAGVAALGAISAAPGCDRPIKNFQAWQPSYEAKVDTFIAGPFSKPSVNATRALQG